MRYTLHVTQLKFRSSMLTQNYITKIEGHGKLKIDFDNNTAKLIVDEGERLFEGLVLGRPYQDIPFIVSRICGICPTSHYLASIKALESALKIVPNHTSVELRKVLLLGQIAQSHILHTFFLALPDYTNVKNVSDLAKKMPAEFSLALKIKSTADQVIKVIGGRAIHPVTPTIGGFYKLPNRSQLVTLRDKLEDNLPGILNLAKFFAGLNYPNHYCENEYLAFQKDDEYAFYDGIVMSSGGHGFEPKKYKEYIKEVVKNYSSAKFATIYGKEFMVGALARVFLHPEKLQKKAANMLNDYFPGHNFPSHNSFHNIFAQIIEILHCFEEMINILNRTIKYGLEESSIVSHTRCVKFDHIGCVAEGIGAIEAPRGTLYHYYKIDKNGLIIDCDIVTPTVQNLSNLEKNTNKLMDNTKNLPQKKREQLIEMLIRAYDPCITCSVH